MSQTLTKPILLDETGVAIKTALNNINDTESQDWLLTYEDVHSEMDDTLQDMADSLKAIKNILDHGTMFEIPQWSDGSDEDIAKALALHYEGAIDLTNYWSVGDERIVHIPAITDKVFENEDDVIAQDIVLTLLDVGSKELVTPINSHTNCAFVVGMKNYLLTSISDSYVSGAEIYIVNPNTYEEQGVGGWDIVDLRTWLNTSFRNALPSSIVSIFKQFKVISSKAYQDSDPEHTTPASKTYAQEVVTNDYFAIPAATELLGDTFLNYVKTNWPWNGVYNIESKLTQFKYYTNTLNRRNIYYENESKNNVRVVLRTMRAVSDYTGAVLYSNDDTYSLSSSIRRDDLILPYGVI